MKVCVIGGSGFVGSKLISILDKNNTVNIDKRESPFFNKITTIADIRNKDQINFSKEIDSVVLLAAEHRDDISPKSLYYDVNVKGTQNILEKMDESNIKSLIFTSSVAIYGLNKNNPSENHEKDPFNDYGKSKWEAEKLIKKWYENDPTNKSVVIIRPTVIFGERNRGNVYNLLKLITSGKFLMIGKGLNKKSMAYVGNIASLIKFKLINNQNKLLVYNYSDKPDLNMLQLVSFIENKMNIKTPKIQIPYLLGMIGGYVFDFISFITNRKLPISSVRVKKFCATTRFDSKKIHLEFNPKFTLKEGLDKTINHEFINDETDDVLFYSE
jgi:GlcNAc-P-P-Und epimerase